MMTLKTSLLHRLAVLALGTFFLSLTACAKSPLQNSQVVPAPYQEEVLENEVANTEYDKLLVNFIENGEQVAETEYDTLLVSYIEDSEQVAETERDTLLVSFIENGEQVAETEYDTFLDNFSAEFKKDPAKIFKILKRENDLEEFEKLEIKNKRTLRFLADYKKIFRAMKRTLKENVSGKDKINTKLNLELRLSDSTKPIGNSGMHALTMIIRWTVRKGSEQILVTLVDFIRDTDFSKEKNEPEKALKCVLKCLQAKEEKGTLRAEYTKGLEILQDIMKDKNASEGDTGKDILDFLSNKTDYDKEKSQRLQQNHKGTRPLNRTKSQK